MADEEDRNSVAVENHERSTGTSQNETSEVQEMKGWLMKRTKISQKWKKQWFLLRKTDLFYGDSQEDHKKTIPLQGAEISETDIDKKQFAFRVKPKNSKRVYYMYADNESVQHEWMQAICFAKAAGKIGDASETCTIQ